MCLVWFVKNNNILVIINISFINNICWLNICFIMFLKNSFIRIVGIMERIILREKVVFLLYLNWKSFLKIFVIFFLKMISVLRVVVVCKVMVISKFFFFIFLLFRKYLVIFKCLLLFIGKNLVRFWIIFSMMVFKILFI